MSNNNDTYTFFTYILNSHFEYIVIPLDIEYFPAFNLVISKRKYFIILIDMILSFMWHLCETYNFFPFNLEVDPAFNCVITKRRNCFIILIDMILNLMCSDVHFDYIVIYTCVYYMI